MILCFTAEKLPKNDQAGGAGGRPGQAGVNLNSDSNQQEGGKSCCK